MSRWLLIPLLALVELSALPALAVGTDSGPTSPSEASILWKDGKAAWQEGRYADVIAPLQRLIDRYPGYDGYLEAHLVLGRALLKLDDPERAIAPLKYYVSARSPREDGIRARLPLGEAYLGTGRFNEAYLDAMEIERSPRATATKDVRANGLLLKARALIGLSHDDRAALAVDAAKRLGKKDLGDDSHVLSDAATVELQLKGRACARMPSEKKLEEGQVQDQLARRGTCVLEALNLYRDAVSPPKAASAELASQEMAAILRGFDDVCRNPPEPPATKPFDRDARQKRTYKEELGVLLRRDCRQRLDEARDIVTGWRKTIPATGKPRMDQVLELIAKLENPATESKP